MEQKVSNSIFSNRTSVGEMEPFLQEPKTVGVPACSFSYQTPTKENNPYCQRGFRKSSNVQKKNEHKVLPPDDTVPTEKRTIKQKTFRPTLQFDSKKSNWRAGLNLFSSLLLIRCCRLMKAKKIKEFCLSILCFASSTT